MRDREIGSHINRQLRGDKYPAAVDEAPYTCARSIKRWPCQSHEGAENHYASNWAELNFHKKVVVKVIKIK